MLSQGSSVAMIHTYFASIKQATVLDVASWVPILFSRVAYVTGSGKRGHLEQNKVLELLISK